MKNFSFLLALLIFPAAGTVYSQTLGVKGGGNMAIFNKAEGSDAVLYWHAGMYLRQGLDSSRKGSQDSRFFFQPELVYSRQGSSFEDIWGDDHWFKNDYVNLGLIFQYRPMKNLALEFGPQAGYLISSHLTAKWIGMKEKENTWSEFRKMDYGLSFGVVYHTGTYIDFSVRYNMGLGDVARYNDGKSIRNGVFQLSMLIDLW